MVMVFSSLPMASRMKATTSTENASEREGSSTAINPFAMKAIFKEDCRMVGGEAGTSRAKCMKANSNTALQLSIMTGCT